MTCRDSDGDGAIARMSLILDKNEIKGRALRPGEVMAEGELEAALKETLASGRVGFLTVDPAYLIIRPPRGN